MTVTFGAIVARLQHAFRRTVDRIKAVLCRHYLHCASPCDDALEGGKILRVCCDGFIYNRVVPSQMLYHSLLCRARAITTHLTARAVGMLRQCMEEHSLSPVIPRLHSTEPLLFTDHGDGNNPN